MPNKWIAVDFDGTLSTHGRTDPNDQYAVGKPIPKMLERVKDWVAQGKTVKIFTGRLGGDGDKDKHKAAISAFLKENGLPDLEVTNIKDHHMEELWDDRAIGVVKNTGEIKGPYDPQKQETLKAKARSNLSQR